MACFDKGDMQGALFILKGLAAEGESYALVEIGHIYELGSLTGTRDFEEAAKWYRKAVFEIGDPKANLGLARLYFNHQLQSDHPLPVLERHATDAAERGEPLGWLLLGLAYEGNRFGSPDRQRAMGYYRRASSAGMVLAQRRLARIAWQSRQFSTAIADSSRRCGTHFRFSIRNPKDPRLTGLAPDTYDIVDLAKEPHNRPMQPTAGSGG